MTFGKGLRTGDATLSCRWTIPKGPLDPSFLKEDLVAMPGLWGALSITQSIIGIWVSRVTGSGSVRASVFKEAQ